VLAIGEGLRALDLPVETAGFLAVSDIAWFSEADIPSVLFGPGTGTNAHGVDERLEIDQLIASVKALTLTAIAWCGVANA
jgi:acetylornithine deacetylase/succinyl-diaminopimelate desuccinylase-like protein